MTKEIPLTPEEGLEFIDSARAKVSNHWLWIDGLLQVPETINEKSVPFHYRVLASALALNKITRAEITAEMLSGKISPDLVTKCRLTGVSAMAANYENFSHLDWKGFAADLDIPSREFFRFSKIFGNRERNIIALQMVINNTHKLNTPDLQQLVDLFSISQVAFDKFLQALK
jgi:hypothetical protein